MLNLNKDKLWPREFKGTYWKMNNIDYNDMALNFDRFNVNFNKKHQEVRVDFPLMEHFEAHAQFAFEHFMGLLSTHGKGTVKVQNMELRATFSEKVQKSGFPLFYCPDFEFYIGGSSLDMPKHKFLSSLLTEFAHIFNVLASQATKWFGMSVVDMAVDHTFAQLTNNYNYPFYIWVQEQAFPFSIDLRQTRKFFIDNDSITLFFLGDVNFAGKRNVNKLPL